MTHDDLLTDENMRIINLFNFDIDESKTLFLKSSILDLTIEIVGDEFDNKYFKIDVSDKYTHIRVIEEGTDLKKELKEALIEWQREFDKVSQTAKEISVLVDKLN